MTIDVKKLALEAGLEFVGKWNDEGAIVCTGALFNRFAALVLEEAARTCDRIEDEDTNWGRESTAPMFCAEAIRALKPTYTPSEP